MPELPEVETTVRSLARVLTGKKIVDIWSSYNSSFYRGKNNIKDRAYFATFRRRLIGHTPTTVTRRAKYIAIHFKDIEDIALIHMKMTGHFLHGLYVYHSKRKVWHPQHTAGPLGDPFNQHIRLMISLNDGTHLAFSDMRKFATFTLLSPTERDRLFTQFGPEPFETTLSAHHLHQRLSHRPKAPIKQVLMDQRVIAGIGNIYSDEILWSSGIHPMRPAGSISTSEAKDILSHARRILQKSINLGGDSMSDFRTITGEKGGFHPHHNAYQQTGLRCKKRGCTGTIQRRVIGGRSAHFCDTHQR